MQLAFYTKIKFNSVKVLFINIQKWNVHEMDDDYERVKYNQIAKATQRLVTLEPIGMRLATVYPKGTS